MFLLAIFPDLRCLLHNSLALLDRYWQIPLVPSNLVSSTNVLMMDTIHVVNTDNKQCWLQDWSLGNITSSWLPAGLQCLTTMPWAWQSNQFFICLSSPFLSSSAMRMPWETGSQAFTFSCPHSQSSYHRRQSGDSGMFALTFLSFLCLDMASSRICSITFHLGCLRLTPPTRIRWKVW